MSIVHIVAYSSNRVIGDKGVIPWYLSSDLKKFKCITWNGMVAMGRKTFESIGKPLPNRTNIVLTKCRSLGKNLDISICNDIDEIIETFAFSGPNLFIIGGGEIYKQTLPYASKIITTEIDTVCPGDVYYPSIPNDFRQIYSQSTRTDGIVYKDAVYVNNRHITYGPCEICKVSNNLIYDNICRQCKEHDG